MFLNRAMLDVDDDSTEHSSEELLPNEVNVTSSAPTSPRK